MSTENLIADLTKGYKLDGKNYDMWNRKIQYLFDFKDQTKLLTNEMVRPQEGNSVQARRDLEAYEAWVKKDRHARYAMLSSMNDDLIGEYENYPTSKQMWDHLKFYFGGTSTTKLRSLVLKFEVYRKDPKHSVTEHLRMMSSMIRDLKSFGNVLTDEQQVLAVIRSLPDSWVHLKQILTHNEGIKHFSDISRHVELEVECQEATRVAALYAQGERKPQDTGATRHVARDRAGFVNYRRLSRGTLRVYIGNGSSEEAVGVGTYQVHMRSGRILTLHDVLYVPGIHHNLFSVIALLSFGYSFKIEDGRLDIIYDSILFGQGYLSNNFFKLDFFNSFSSDVLVTNASSSVVDDCMTWHARLGHIVQDRMTRLAQEGHLGSLSKVSLPVCEPCLEGKAF
ncbi:uncharacterized protein LOC113315726 [Papaver somniferum]|uniref:uncharacterized protein LOC113315726 n=1 Tax=Papaver somniferum TaxID=3469 RepID=UPI000E704050|nr:uncharacterized protein LOC113315726 [Papaver somniferum]